MIYKKTSPLCTSVTSVVKSKLEVLLANHRTRWQSRYDNYLQAFSDFRQGTGCVLPE